MWARGLLRPDSYTVGALAVAYAVCQLLKDQEVPSKAAWTSGRPLGWLLLATGVLALIGGFLVFIGFGRVVTKQQQNVELDEACRGLWAFVVDVLGLEMKAVGVHVWGVKGPKGCRYLERRATFVIEPRRETQVIWRKGKGAIGVAWDEDEPKIAARHRL